MVTVLQDGTVTLVQTLLDKKQNVVKLATECPVQGYVQVHCTYYRVHSHHQSCVIDICIRFHVLLPVREDHWNAFSRLSGVQALLQHSYLEPAALPIC